MAMAGEAVALADELGLRDRVVFFNFGWVPYAERGRYLLEADVARLGALRRRRDPVRVPDPTPRLPLGRPARRHDARRHARRADRRRRCAAAPSTSATWTAGSRRSRLLLDDADPRSSARGSRRPRSDRRSSGRAWSRRSATSPIRRTTSARHGRPRSRRRARVLLAAPAHRLARHGLRGSRATDARSSVRRRSAQARVAHRRSGTLGRHGDAAQHASAVARRVRQAPAAQPADPSRDSRRWTSS